MEDHEADDIIRAIRDGEVDAFVVKEAAEERIYSLRSADVLYRAMIEQMKDGAVALDPSGLIVYCNAYFAQLVKAERGTLVGKKVVAFTPGEGEEFFAALRDRPREGTTRRELELRATDGTSVPVMMAMNPIGLGDGSDVYCLIVTDLSEQKRRDQLVIEGRRKDEFLAMLAHELRNPIAPIRYASARLAGKNLTRERLEWARNVIDRQVDQLTRLVDDLLDVSRITRGRVSLDLKPLEIDTVVARAIEAVRPLIEARNQRLTISRPGKRLSVKGDATRLAQAISNLLNNASKFTGEGGHLSVAVSVEAREPGWVRVVVGDDGCGIAPELMPQIFGLFAQADTSQQRAQSGLGIGLTLVRSFVEMHGGTVTGESAGPGHGSRFTVRLPLLGTAADTQPPAREPRAASSRKGVGMRRILVVDDNADVADSLCAWLEDCGHEVRVARTGAAALREAESFRPEVMFIDIGLPDMSGHETARRLRSMPALNDTLLVAVTGYGQQEDRRRSQEAGFNDHWIKPLTSEMLTTLLATLDAAARTGRAGRAARGAAATAPRRRAPRSRQSGGRVRGPS
jgi:PAS domain S-box-containing protein